MYIELRISELRDIKSLLKEIEYDLSLAINGTHDYIDNGGYIEGNYSTAVSKGMEERNAELQEAMGFIQNFEQRIDEVIEAVKYSGKVNNEEIIFIYDSEQFEKNLNAIKDLLDFNGEEYRQVINASSGYIDWEDSVTKKLDNPDANIFDAVEELKQQDDERVFRHNRDIMNGLEDKIRDITYLDCIENIEDIKKKLDGLDSLNEIKEITEILVDNTRFGLPTKGNTNINTIDGSDVDKILLEEMINSYKDSIPDEIMNMIEKFKSGGTLVVSGSLITDDILQELNNIGFFNIENANGSYKFSLKYDDMTKWARENTDILDNIVERAMKNGLSGIYKLDPNTGKWYMYDEVGNIKYLTELPNGVSKGVGAVGEVLGPLGIAIDVDTIYQGWKTGDPSELGGAVGSVAGGSLGAAIALSFVTEGASLVYYFLAMAGGGFIGSWAGDELGTSLGELFEEEKIYWEE